MRRLAVNTLEAVAARAGGGLALIDRNPRTRRAALRVLPQALERLIVTEYLTDLETVLELRIFASRGGPEERYAVVIGHGEVRVRPGGDPAARAWFGARLSDIIRIATGRASWTEMLAAGRLQIGGDPFTALRAPLLFGFSPALRRRPEPELSTPPA
jgi:hypothetical protein